ncbi:MAG: FAD-dependent oxidoreductase [Gemmatimonadota bacterium]
MSDDLSARYGTESSLTRRQVLKWFGALGGSSVMLGAMGALELRGQPIRPRPIFSGQAQDTRVIVLGAGVSGMVVGYELGKLGYDYQILEARDRVGGLNWSVRRGDTHTELGPGGETQVCEFDEGQYVNAGPWRLPHDHHGILGYAKELDVRMEPFNDLNEVLFSEDPALGPLANRMLLLRELTSDMWGHTAELLAKALDQGSLDSELSTEDKDRLLQFLTSAGYLSNPDRIYQPNARVRGSEDPYDLSLLLQSGFANQVRSLTSGTGGPVPVLQPTGGMQQIPLAFQRFHGPRVTLNAKVISIRTLENEVRVVWEDTQSGARQEVAADYVVSCLPMTILKQLEVNFSPEVAAVVQAYTHSSSSKIGLQMARRFWEEDHQIYGGHLQFRAFNPQAAPQPAAGGGGRGGGGGGGGGGNPLPSFSYPSNDYGAKKGVLLGFYGGPNVPGIDGVPLIDSPVRMRFEHVLTHASKVHPQMRQEFESAYAIMWPRVPFSEGAWGQNPGENMDLLSQAHGRIYLGSAAISGDPAWQEGAVESAWRAVELIHARVMGQ